VHAAVAATRPAAISHFTLRMIYLRRVPVEKRASM
jgi:hypothetical protein